MYVGGKIGRGREEFEDVGDGMDRTDVQFDSCKTHVSKTMNEVHQRRRDSLLPPAMVTWMAILSADSSLLLELEAAEPDRERMMARLCVVEVRRTVVMSRNWSGR